MELLQLRYFVTVSRYQSITKAAAYHNVPQPAMSQTIARLEADLGNTRLFDRKNGRIFLNEQGKLFLGYAEKALQMLDDGLLALHSREERISGAIRILVMENRRFILNCITRFSEQYPEVNFFVSHDFYSEQDTAYDLCISSVQTYRQMRGGAPLIREQIVLAVHESNPLALMRTVTLQELRNEIFITMPVRSSLYSITYDRCRAAGFEPQVRYICDDPYFVRKYVSENMGVALAPAVSWAGRFRNNTKVIPVTEPQMTTTSYLLWDDTRFISPALAKFRDFLLGESRKIPGNLL